MTVQPVVEGPGDERAMPILVRRILLELVGCHDAHCLRPFKLDRGKMVKEEPSAKTLAVAQLNEAVDYIVLVMDADKDCSKEIKENVSTWGANVVYRAAFDVICIEKEYECWLLAAIESLHGVRGIDASAGVPNDVNAIRGAKGRISERMPAGISYSETADQPALTAMADLQQISARCPSFHRFVEKLRHVHNLKCQCT